MLAMRRAFDKFGGVIIAAAGFDRVNETSRLWPAGKLKSPLKDVRCLPQPASVGKKRAV
jgi:hypothetical protein